MVKFYVLFYVCHSRALLGLDFQMDLENFSRSDIKRHLADLGYSNINEEKLDSFIRYSSRVNVFQRSAMIMICSEICVS